MAPNGCICSNCTMEELFDGCLNESRDTLIVQTFIVDEIIARSLSRILGVDVECNFKSFKLSSSDVLFVADYIGQDIIDDKVNYKSIKDFMFFKIIPIPKHIKH